MINGISSALSGLTFFQKRLDVSANNIANSSTENFKKSRVDAAQDESGAPRPVVTKINTPGIPIHSVEDRGPRESSNVDIAQELVNTMNAKRGFITNLKSIEAQEETQEALLDLLA